MSNLTEDERHVSYTFKPPTAAKMAEINDLVARATGLKVCTDYVLDHRAGVIYRIPKEESGWRLERAVRRVARRDMLRDCRTRCRRTA